MLQVVNQHSNTVYKQGIQRTRVSGAGTEAKAE